MNRRLMIGVALAATLLAGQALAAPQSFEGAWEAFHTEIPGATTPPEFKLTIWMRVEGDKLHYHSENTTRPDTPYISDHISTLDGKPAPFPNQTRFNQVETLVTEPNELQILKTKDGDVIAGEFWSISPGGKTATRRGVGKNPDGKSHAYQEHFRRVDKPWPVAAAK
ncbi:MAG: hypothetical protein JWO33_2777 [Caulobacteraceae bacterium]|nr:hypothetical protein [Caulobacteraceae bacterium]